MFYFPLFSGRFPEWVPFWGGQNFQFFRPVFNVADAAITTGVFSLLLFHRNFFSGHPEKKENKEQSVAQSEPLPTGRTES